MIIILSGTTTRSEYHGGVGMNPSWVAVHPVLCMGNILYCTLREEPLENPVVVLVGPPIICSLKVVFFESNS